MSVVLLSLEKLGSSTFPNHEKLGLLIFFDHVKACFSCFSEAFIFL